MRFDRRLEYAILFAILVLGGGLRLYGLRDAGVTHLDDLRAYTGPEIIEALSARDVPLARRVANAHRISIDGTGARPALAWLLLVPATLGFSSIGDLYVPFALCGVLTVLAVWILCRRWFDVATAAYAALWLAVNAAHVNYSRSALPPTPAMTLMVIGLLVLSERDDTSALSRRRLFVTGWYFAFAAALHPAYLVYTLAPVLWVVRIVLRQRLKVALVVGSLIRSTGLLIAPTAILLALYDTPRAIAELLRGHFEAPALLYLDELWRLFNSPTVYGTHEGFLFWPRYLLASEGVVGFGIIVIALLGGLALHKTDSERDRIAFLLIWLVAPLVVFSGWPNLNSYGRLYAPLLPALACLVGLGTSRILSAISRHVRSTAAIAYALVAVLLASTGLLASSPMIAFPGREPAVGRYMRQNSLTQTMAFFRTDVRALTGIGVHLVSEPGDVNRIRCQRETDLFLLSPAAFSYVLLHENYLFQDLKLEPVFTYPNPYSVPGRLMEGEVGIPRDFRRAVLTEARFAKLGLFRIGRSRDCY